MISSATTLRLLGVSITSIPSLYRYHIYYYHILDILSHLSMTWMTIISPSLPSEHHAHLPYTSTGTTCITSITVYIFHFPRVCSLLDHVYNLFSLAHNAACLSLIFRPQQSSWVGPTKMSRACVVNFAVHLQIHCGPLLFFCFLLFLVLLGLLFSLFSLLCCLLGLLFLQ